MSPSARRDAVRHQAGRARPQVAFAADEARRHPPRHVHHRRRAARTSSSTPARSGCGSSRRPSTRTTRPSTTSSTPTSAAAPAPTSRSSSTRARRRAAPATGWCTASSSASRSEEALDFWAERAGGDARATARVLLRRSGGARARARRRRLGRRAARREHPEIPEEHALRGFAGVRAYASDPERERDLLLEASASTPGWEARGEQRGGFYVYDDAAGGARPPGRRHGAPRRLGLADGGARGLARAGRRRRRPADAGDRPLLLPLDLLPRAERRAVRDRDARRPGFTADEPLETLGERLSLPPDFEQLREQLERRLTPLPNPRAARVSVARAAAPRASAEGALVLFHGRGADEHDLLAAARRARPRAAARRLLPARRRCRCRPAARTGTSCRASATPTRDVRRGLRRGVPGSSTRCRTSGSCSAASRRAR